MPPITLSAVGKAYRAYCALRPGSPAAHAAWAEFERLAFGWAEGHAQSEKITLNLSGERETVHLARRGTCWTVHGPGVPEVEVN